MYKLFFSLILIGNYGLAMQIQQQLPVQVQQPSQVDEEDEHDHEDCDGGCECCQQKVVSTTATVAPTDLSIQSQVTVQAGVATAVAIATVTAQHVRYCFCGLKAINCPDYLAALANGDQVGCYCGQSDCPDRAAQRGVN